MRIDFLTILAFQVMFPKSIRSPVLQSHSWSIFLSTKSVYECGVLLQYISYHSTRTNYIFYIAIIMGFLLCAQCALVK